MVVTIKGLYKQPSMIQKILLVVLLFISCQLSYGQIIRIQAGPTVSNLDWSVENIIPRGENQVLVGNSVFLGYDYLPSRHFNLSSNIGYLRKGDISEITYINDEGQAFELPSLKVVFDYFSLNTQAEVNFPFKKRIIPFISAGPRIEYLYSYTKDFSFIEELDDLPTFYYGLNLGGGIKYDLPRWQVGLRSEYYVNLTNIAEWVSSDVGKGWINDQTFLINLSVGYKLK
jgi:hypothetical protein